MLGSGDRGGVTGVDRFLTDPERNVAAIAQRLVIFGPVFDTIGSVVFGVSVGSFVGPGHGDHRWLSGGVMSPA